MCHCNTIFIRGVRQLMNRKLLSVLLFSLIFMVACSNNAENEVVNENETNEAKQNEESEAFPVTVNIDDKEITVENKPENILPMSLETAEIVLALTDASDVVATTKGIDDPLLSTQ